MLKKENFKIRRNENDVISGDITYSERTSKKVAVFVHGFKGFKDWGAHNLVANFFAYHAINYVKFNFSLSGVNHDNPIDITEMELFAANMPSIELLDLELIIDFVDEKFIDADITLIGHSRGGGISILTAANDKRIHKLITWAAIDNFSSLWKKEQEEEWRKNGQIEVYNARTKEFMPLNLSLLEDVEKNPRKLNILNSAEELNIPWLIIHGNEDINVSIEVGRNFKGINSNAEFLEIKDANHVFNASHPYNQSQLPKALLTVCEASVKFINK
jgi:pimeloyl-ACP methyl ester carboxylesterase